MEPEKKSNGATVGLIVIVIILIIGGVYIWKAKVRSAMEEKKTAEMNAAKAGSNSEVTSSDSAEVDALGEDLDSTSTNVDVDVNSLK